MSDQGTGRASDADTQLAKVERTRRSRSRRHAERSKPELAEGILRAGRVAHVAYMVEGQPYVLPMAYWYEEGVLYLHGAPASRTVRALAAGSAVCIEVTLLEGLVVSRDAKSHSMNYRSVMVFGRAEAVREEAAMRRAFEAMTAHYFPGRTAGTDYLPAEQNDLRAVELLAVEVEELSAKARSGPPLGKHDGDADSPYSGYVLALPGADA